MINFLKLVGIMTFGILFFLIIPENKAYAFNDPFPSQRPGLWKISSDHSWISLVNHSFLKSTVRLKALLVCIDAKSEAYADRLELDNDDGLEAVSVKKVGNVYVEIKDMSQEGFDYITNTTSVVESDVWIHTDEVSYHIKTSGKIPNVDIGDETISEDWYLGPCPGYMKPGDSASITGGMVDFNGGKHPIPAPQ